MLPRAEDTDESMVASRRTRAASGRCDPQPRIVEIVVLATLVVLTMGLLVRASDAHASAISAFSTPGRAAECILPENFGEGAKTPFGRLLCWTPNDGFAVEMSYDGRVRRTSLDRRGMSPGYIRTWARMMGTLDFGKDWTWSFDARGFGTLYYRCASRTAGLTCTNRAGHGWWLGRLKGYRIF
jgi:hypothetical protein